MLSMRFLVQILAMVAVLLAPMAAKADGHTDRHTGRMNWTGFYIGASAGFVAAESATTGTSNDAFDDVLGNGYTITTSPTGLFGIGQLGFNVQTGNIVFGVEVETGYLDVSGGKTFDPSAPPSLTDTGIQTHYGRYGVGAIRLGYALDRTLIYAKGGIAFSDVEHSAGDIGLAPFYDLDDVTRISSREWGYAIGGGAEYAITSHWSLKGEYLHLDLGTVGSTNSEDDTFETEFKVHTFKVGLNYRF